MATGHGGRRQGAGRPRKKGPVSPADQLPLEYLLAIMRDPSADVKRRDWAAKAAAPYVHARGGAMHKRPSAADELVADVKPWAVLLGDRK
jgi:hypothetical protein